MSGPVSLQADVGNIPSNALSLLGSLSPLLRALSADNVSPLAVVQAEALGARFQINGELAARVPDLLTRSSSTRLDRLSHWVGWMAGDTPSAMAQTAGGKAASLLSLTLIELYGESQTGVLLYRLSEAILPADQRHSSMIQLGQVAANLSNKLTPLAFGSHLAVHVTRIRETYFNCGLDIPRTILDNFTMETMADFFSALHSALHEETSLLYIEGFQGLGPIVAIVLALCPDDTRISVENETLFQGARRSVVISINSKRQTKFVLETILRDERVTSDLVFSVDMGLHNAPTKLWPFNHLSMKVDGCLSDALNLALVPVATSSTPELRFSIVELITAISFSCKTNGLRCPEPPREGLKDLLGPDIMNRLRDKLTLLFGVEPSMTSFDCISAYHSLKSIVSKAIPSAVCSCGQCFGPRPWSNPNSIESCPVMKFWDSLSQIMGNAIALLFITHDANACVSLGWPTKLGSLLPDAIMRLVDENLSVLTLFGYTMNDLHVDIWKRIDTFGFSDDILGASNDSVSIFPSTILEPKIHCPQSLIYLLVDGRFHNRRIYYKYLTSDNDSSHAGPQEPGLRHNAPITPSSAGVHSSLTLTVQPHYNQLKIRAMVEASGATFHLDFLALHIASMGLPSARPCSHNPNDAIEEDNAADIMTTSVVAPLGQEDCISLVTTHQNPEAQFLCGMPDVPTLFQGGSCLNCAVKEGREKGIRMIIQS